jgi:hypothetical protein
MKLSPVPRALALVVGLSAVAMQAQAATPAGTSITNQASATYLDSGLVARTATSNTVVTVVQQVASVSLSAGSAKNGSASGQVVYAHTITNNGNAADTFTLSSTNSGAFSMANVAFFADTNGDGIADNATPITSTGSLAPGAAIHVVAVATLPAGATAGAVNSVVVSATSAFNATAAATATDTTTVVAASTVDITVNAPGSGAPGAGAGAETSAVSTNTTAAGTTTRFALYLNNAGTGTDTFNLAASNDPNFGTTTLPNGWTVTFKDAGNATITSASVAGGASTVVYAEISVPAGAAPGTVDTYFRALSPTSSVSDRIHAAVTVTAAEAAQLSVAKTQALDANCDGIADTAFSAANITAGAIPGACIRYEITATNNSAVGAVTTLVISDNIPANTTYHATVPAQAAGGVIGTVAAPSAGSTGQVTDTVSLLGPGANAKLSFGVRINP